MSHSMEPISDPDRKVAGSGGPWLDETADEGAPEPDETARDLRWAVPYRDGEAADLTVAAIHAALAAHAGTWSAVQVLSEVGSTNSLAVQAVAAGAGTGTTFVADFQSAGRGRLDRQWLAPPGSSAMFSVVLRPADPRRELGPLPLLCGLAVAEAIEAVTGLRVGLKWPNDVMLTSGRPGKVAGLLAERTDSAVVVGIGINVSTTQLPVPAATSLALAGASPLPRAELIGAALARLEKWFTAWETSAQNSPQPKAGGQPRAGQAGDPLAEYRRRCTTLGRPVQVVLPGGRQLVGRGVGIGAAGELLVDVGDRVESVVVGDVIHAREQ